MKKTLTILSVLALLGMFVAACGGSKNDCEKAGDIMSSGMDEACASKPDSCCMCKCWKDGHKNSSQSGQTCTCTASETTSGDCSGEALNQAQQCLANESACKQTGAGIVAFACPAT